VLVKDGLDVVTTAARRDTGGRYLLRLRP